MMTKGQMVFTIFLVVSSVILFVVAIIWWINRIIKNRRVPEKSNKAGVSTGIVFSVFLIFSIWILRFAVGYFSVIVPKTDIQQLDSWEEIINSLFGALRTFSMEEEYAEYIINIKRLVEEIVPCEHWSFSIIQIATVAYASILNLLAPIIGGAIVLEILSSVFPKIKLRWSYIKYRRPKYFFSELNTASLSLAKSIYYNEKDKKPILIFTDTYVDDEKEKEYELLLEAKRYGAICVHDDLEHVVKNRFGKHVYFLMDENEFGNLQTLMSLIDDHNVKFIKDSQIYLFVQSDAYVQIEKQFYEELKNEEKKKLLKGREAPVIVPVYGYRNLVHDLLVDVPLYEPLVHKKDNTKLNVTILGNGVIGTEAFLSSYWFGQMLISRNEDGKKSMSECELTINVVSKDSKNVFWSKIDYINSEIKETVEVLENNVESDKSELLKYDNEGHTNNPYCRVRYIKADVKVGGFWDSDSEEAKELLESDYFIVALGNDADNISVADKLRRLVGKKHLEETMDGAGGNVIITYSVFESELAKALNNQKHCQCREKGKTDIYMHAFGSLEQVYSYDNVYIAKHKVFAEMIGATYDNVKMRQKHIVDNKTRKNNANKNYSHWADLARAMHFKYKVFSLGLIKESVFDYNSNESELTHKSYVEGQCNLYKQIIMAKSPEGFSEETINVYNEVQLKQHALAWLEHRRWNAFTRTMGYQHTDEIEKNLQLNGVDCKNMEIKLHPCLVEAKKPILNCENIYLQEKMKELFVNLSDVFDINMLKKDKMIALLHKKKDHLLLKTKKYSEMQNVQFDLLDKLTYEWCQIATRANMIMIDDALQNLQEVTTELGEEEIKTIFKNAWNGVFCYDFKMYDYYTYDYSEG